jgi:hypothetical protein
MNRMVQAAAVALALGGAAVLSFLLLSPGGPAERVAASSAPAPDSAVVEGDEQATTTFVWICYDLRGGADEQATVRLITKNFGGDLVRVRKLVRMCEGSYKYPVGTVAPVPPNGPILACYIVGKGNNPQDPYQLTTANFGTDQVIVGASRLMCESAIKRHVGSDKPPVGQTGAPIWQCYNLREGHVIDKEYFYTNQNFGPGLALVRQLVMLCEEAAKERTDAAGNVTTVGQASGAVVACYSITSNQNPAATVVLRTDNFGRDQVAVHQATLLCERADKKPVFHFPTDPTD